VAEVVVQNRRCKGIGFLELCPTVMSGFVPGSGKEAAKVLPWVPHLIAIFKGNILVSIMAVSPKHCLLTGGICYRFQPALSGNRKCLTVCFIAS